MRFVCVIRVSRVSLVCPGSPGVFLPVLNRTGNVQSDPMTLQYR